MYKISCIYILLHKTNCINANFIKLAQIFWHHKLPILTLTELWLPSRPSEFFSHQKLQTYSSYSCICIICLQTLTYHWQWGQPPSPCPECPLRDSWRWGWPWGAGVCTTRCTAPHEAPVTTTKHIYKLSWFYFFTILFLIMEHYNSSLYCTTEDVKYCNELNNIIIYFSS